MYPTQPDFATGQFYGPTDAAAGQFPGSAYLTLAQFQAWQLQRQLALNQAASAQFDAIEKEYGIGAVNPYTSIIAGIEAAIAAQPA